jgi:hypothetical protein
MPDYQFNTNLSPAAQGTNLRDLIATAGGIQQFQQAQQMNPLALQKAQMEIEQLKKINPLAERKATAEAGTAELGLNAAQTSALYGLAGGVLNDPRIQKGDKKEVLSALKEAEQRSATFGIPKEVVQGVFGQLNSFAESNHGSVKQVLGNIVQSGLGARGQQETAAGQEAVQGTDIYGNPLVVRTNLVTGEKVQKPLPTVSGTVGTPTGVRAADMGLRFAPGESAGTVEGMQAERAQAKQSAVAAASALTNIETIKKYLPLAQTGKYSEAVAGLQSAFGNLAGSTAEEKAASARDIIQKNIADLGLQKNAALGNKFAADLSAVQQSIADAGKNPSAILKSMEQLEPLIQHAQLYQQGLEKAIEKNGGNIQVKRKYDNEMVTAFDPKALMAYNAYKAGDKKALSGLSAQEKEQLFAKIQRYARLVNGDL